MLQLAKINWLKTLSPVAIAASIFLLTELPATAIPHISLPSRSRSSIRSSQIRRHSATRSLNITPRTHIPLPRRSSSYYHYPSSNYYYSDYDRYDRHHRVRRVRVPKRGVTRTVIINPVLKY